MPESYSKSIMSFDAHCPPLSLLTPFFVVLFTVEDGRQRFLKGERGMDEEGGTNS